MSVGGGDAGGDGVVVGKGSKLVHYGPIQGGEAGSADRITSTIGSKGSFAGRAESGYVINAGTVKHSAKAAGDQRPDGEADVNSIDVVGDHSTLELWKGSDIQGNAAVADGVKDASLVLGGDEDPSLAASELGTKYTGFENFKKTGSSKWDFAGKTDAHTPWTIAEGILSIAEDGSLGNVSDAVTINGGTLQTNGSIDLDRNVVLGDKNGTIDTQANTNTLNGVVSGAGALIKAGNGTLIVKGESTFTGEANIANGTLALAGKGSIATADRVNNNGTFDISGVDPDHATIKSLAGGETSNVALVATRHW